MIYFLMLLEIMDKQMILTVRKHKYTLNGVVLETVYVKYLPNTRYLTLWFQHYGISVETAKQCFKFVYFFDSWTYKGMNYGLPAQKNVDSRRNMKKKIHDNRKN